MAVNQSDTKDKGYTDLQVAATVHIEPYGLYSSKYKSIGEVPDGGLVLLSNNVSNVARGLSGKTSLPPLDSVLREE